MVKASKRAFALMLALLCLLAGGTALAEIGLVNDEAGLYTAAEIAQMEAIIGRRAWFSPQSYSP